MKQLLQRIKRPSHKTLNLAGIKVFFKQNVFEKRNEHREPYSLKTIDATMQEKILFILLQSYSNCWDLSNSQLEK